MARLLLCLAVLIPFWSAAGAQTRITVALTSVQPPLVLDETGTRGLVPDVIAAMNDLQSDFQFVPMMIPARRLLSFHRETDVDVVAYNDLQWGWVDRGGRAGLPLTSGRDLFFSLRGDQVERTEEIGAVRGFHYAFAGFDADALSEMPHVQLVKDEAAVLRLVEHGRVKKGIVSAAFLSWIGVSEPQLYARLDVNTDQPDHIYQRQWIVMPTGRISVPDLDALMRRMAETGRLQEIYGRYGVVVPDWG